VSDRRERGGRARRLEGRGCVRRAQEARLQSLAMQLAESDCTLRVTNTHLCGVFSCTQQVGAKNAKHVESDSVREQKMKCWWGKE
jgi:hypothetical protein